MQVAQADERLLRTRLGYMTIGAPFGGKISQRFVEPGDVAPKHTHLLTLIDPSLLVTGARYPSWRRYCATRTATDVESHDGQRAPRHPTVFDRTAHSGRRL